MKLLVIIVTYNGMQWLDRCIGSVKASSVPADLFVCDNDSTDGTAAFVESHYPEAHLVRSAENLGFARANDMGLRYAYENGYDYIYLLNQDAWVMPDTFGKLISEFEADQSWGILSPVQMKADLSAPDVQFGKHCLHRGKTESSPYPVKFVMAAHWMISRNCLETVGLFSPAFTHYGEDNNYCDRTRFHGLGVGIVPTAKAVHDRASRPRPKDYRMSLKKGFARVCVSNPNIAFAVEVVLQPLILMAQSLRWLSAVPVGSVPALIREYPELKKYRNESKHKKAFL